MAFWKTISAEAFDLLETTLGEIALITARHHALHHFGEECMDCANAFECRHSAAQLVGFAGCEACGDNRDLHRLFLKERHA